MDFGRLGTLVHAETGTRQTVWALAVVLPFSRFAFVWPLVHQTLDEVIAGLEASWRFFDGLPQRLVVDNFPAAVAGPDPLQPRLTRGFLEYSQVRGFVVDPARVSDERCRSHGCGSRSLDSPTRRAPSRGRLVAPLPRTVTRSQHSRPNLTRVVGEPDARIFPGGSSHEPRDGKTRVQHASCASAAPDAPDPVGGTSHQPRRPDDSILS